MGEELELFPDLDLEPNLDLFDSTNEDDFTELEKVSFSDESLTLFPTAVDKDSEFSTQENFFLLSGKKVTNFLTVDDKVSMEKKFKRQTRGKPGPNTIKREENISPPPKSGKGLSKNALAARENRIKKKKYIEDLENSTTSMREKINQLEKDDKNKSELIEKLIQENKYLRGVLANMPGISSLLKSIQKTPHLKFTGSNLSSTEPRKRKIVDDGNNNKKKRLFSETDEEIAGVCLHVTGDFYSLEFCPTCSRSASSLKESDGES